MNTIIKQYNIWNWITPIKSFRWFSCIIYLCLSYFCFSSGSDEKKNPVYSRRVNNNRTISISSLSGRAEAEFVEIISDKHKCIIKYTFMLHVHCLLYRDSGTGTDFKRPGELSGERILCLSWFCPQKASAEFKFTSALLLCLSAPLCWQLKMGNNGSNISFWQLLHFNMLIRYC